MFYCIRRLGACLTAIACISICSPPYTLSLQARGDALSPQTVFGEDQRFEDWLGMKLAMVGKKIEKENGRLNGRADVRQILTAEFADGRSSRQPGEYLWLGQKETPVHILYSFRVGLADVTLALNKKSGKVLLEHLEGLPGKPIDRQALTLAGMQAELDLLLSESPAPVEISDSQRHAFRVLLYARRHYHAARQSMEKVSERHIAPLAWADLFLTVVNILPLASGNAEANRTSVQRYLGHAWDSAKVWATAWVRARWYAVREFFALRAMRPGGEPVYPEDLLFNPDRSLPLSILEISEILDDFVPEGLERLGAVRQSLEKRKEAWEKRLESIGLQLKGKPQHPEGLTGDAAARIEYLRGLWNLSEANPSLLTPMGKIAMEKDMAKQLETLEEFRRQGDLESEAREIRHALRGLDERLFAVCSQEEIGRLGRQRLDLTRRLILLRDFAQAVPERLRQKDVGPALAREFDGRVREAAAQTARRIAEVDNALRANIFFLKKNTVYLPHVNLERMTAFYGPYEPVRGFAASLQADIGLHKAHSSHFGFHQTYPFQTWLMDEKKNEIETVKRLRSQNVQMRRVGVFPSKYEITSPELGAFAVSLEVVPAAKLSSLGAAHVESRNILLNQASLISPLLAQEVIHQELDHFLVKDEDPLDPRKKLNPAFAEMLSMLRSFQRVEKWSDTERDEFFHLFQKGYPIDATHNYHQLLQQYLKEGLTEGLVKAMVDYIRAATMVYHRASPEMQKLSYFDVYRSLAAYFEANGEPAKAMRFYSLGLQTYPHQIYLKNNFTRLLYNYAALNKLNDIASDLEPAMLSPLIDAVLRETVLTPAEMDLLKGMMGARLLALGDVGRVRNFFVARGEMLPPPSIMDAKDPDVWDALVQEFGSQA